MTVASSVDIHFQGLWTEAECSRLRNALADAEARMTAAQKAALNGIWLTRSTGSGNNRYIVLHRAGMGEAFAGHRVEDIVEKVERRWGASAS
jgi:hypothetical protein